MLRWMMLIFLAIDALPALPMPLTLLIFQITLDADAFAASSLFRDARFFSPRYAAAFSPAMR